MKIAGLIHTPGCWQEDHVFGFLGCGGGQFVVSNFLCFSLIAKFYFNVFSCWIWLPTTSECKIEANTYDLVLGVGVLVCQFISHKQFLKLCRMSFFPHHQSQHVLRRPLQVFWFRLAFAHNVFVTLDSGCFLRRTIEFYHSVQGHAIRLFFIANSAWETIFCLVYVTKILQICRRICPGLALLLCQIPRLLDFCSICVM